MLTKCLKKDLYTKKYACSLYKLPLAAKHTLRQTNNYDLNLNRQPNDIWDDVKKNCLSSCYAFISIFRIDMSIHLKVLLFFFLSASIHQPAIQPKKSHQ